MVQFKWMKVYTLNILEVNYVEPFAFLFSIIPLLIIFLVYLAVVGLIIWFIISFLKTQKERNVILREISNKLDNRSVINEEE